MNAPTINDSIPPELATRIEDLNCKFGTVIQRYRDISSRPLLERLANVLDAVGPLVTTKVATMIDHKGVLEVTWCDKPTERDICAVEHAWRFIANEESVNHYVRVALK